MKVYKFFRRVSLVCFLICSTWFFFVLVPYIIGKLFPETLWGYLNLLMPSLKAEAILISAGCGFILLTLALLLLTYILQRFLTPPIDRKIVVIIDIHLIDTGAFREIKQQIRTINPYWKLSVSNMAMLKICLDVHRNDRVYVFGFDKENLSGYPQVVEHIKLTKN